MTPIASICILAAIPILAAVIEVVREMREKRKNE